MALKNKPAFEAQDVSDVAVIEKPVAQAAAAVTEAPAATVAADTAPAAVVTEAATTAPEAAAASAEAPAAAPVVEAPQTSVAVRANAALSAVVKRKYAPALEEFHDAIDQASLDFNTFPRITVGLEGFTNVEGNIELGKEIKLQIMSWGNRFTISPGVDDDDAKQHVRYSLDGITIDGSDQEGMLVTEYVQHLKITEGYKDAARKEYLTIFGFLTHANGEEIADVDRGIVALQVPPQSKAYFTRFQMETGVKISAGILESSDTLTCKQEKQIAGTKKFAAIKFSR